MSDQLRKDFRKAVRTEIWPVLREAGFTEFSELTAWRQGEKSIDCVQLQTISPTRFGFPETLGWDRQGKDINATEATFMLYAGTYYLDLHLLPWTGPAPQKPRFARGESSQYPTCHRWISLATSIPEPAIQGTIFRATAENLALIVADARKALVERGLPWVDSTHDIPNYLRRVTEPYQPEQPAGLRFTPDEMELFKEWGRKHGMTDEVVFTLGHLPKDFPPALVARIEQMKEAANLRDHLAGDMSAPYGDLLYGLLAGQGRWEEAIGAMRASLDSRPLTGGHEDWKGDPAMKRSLAALQRAEKRYLATEAEHLQALEALCKSRR